MGCVQFIFVINIFKCNDCLTSQFASIEFESNVNRSVLCFCLKGSACCNFLSVGIQDFLTGLLIHQDALYGIFLSDS